MSFKQKNYKNKFKKIISIFGLGKLTTEQIFTKVGLNLRIFPTKLQKIHSLFISKFLNKITKTKILKNYISENISFYQQIKTHKGIHNFNKLKSFIRKSPIKKKGNLKVKKK